MTTKHFNRLIAIMVLAFCFAESIAADSVVTNESGSADFDEEMDEVEIDVQGSIDDTEERRGISLDGDLRFGHIFSGNDFQDVTIGDSDILRARWRIRSIWGFSNQLRGAIRVAGICSTEDCDPDFILQPEIPTPASLKDGQITIDNLFLRWFRTERFDVAVGRMETKFVARGGVYAKSLDRNDSNNLRINWTDGVHTTYKARNGWESHMVLQYNSKNGPSNVRRDPLDFSASKSRVSYFFAFENLQHKRRLVQRVLDITYMPASLRADGVPDGRVEDYWAVVARTSSRWPVRSEGWRFRFSSELGYAPNTPTNSAVGIVGDGAADGFAWNVTASIMDFVPKHSFGINYAITGAGWLLSPQYSGNERLFEMRYVWRPTDQLTLDVRGRWRDEQQPRIIENPARDRFDFYARFTWPFKLRES